MKEIGKYEIIHAKVEDYLEEFDGKRFHAVLCDPPYALGFMGEEWDSPGSWVEADNTPYHRHTDAPVYKAGLEFQAWTTKWGKLMLEVEAVYPGALAMVFGGTRTFHRMACGLEDAGWEVWDAISRNFTVLRWCYGSGFPKGQDISKLIDKSMGAEREVVGQKQAGIGTSNDYAFKQMSEGIKADRMVDVTAPATPEAKIWDGYKTPSLKPAWEPIICVRAPRGNKSYTEIALKHGSGCLNVDDGRIAFVDEKDREGALTGYDEDDKSQIYGAGLGFFASSHDLSKETHPQGRYPPNLILECICDEVIPGKAGETSVVPRSEKDIKRFKRWVDQRGGSQENFPDHPRTIYGDTAPIHTDPNCPASMLDEQSGVSKSSGGRIGKKDRSNIDFGLSGKYAKGDPGYGDRGGSSRFFYVAKAHRTEREAGLRGVIPCAVCGELKSKTHFDDDNNELSCIRNSHPTQKPILLNEWLAKLLLPPKEIGERRLFVPFCGTGSEMIGALKAGWDYVVGVEMEEKYVKIAKARLKFWIDYKNILVLDKKKYRMYVPERADKFW